MRADRARSRTTASEPPASTRATSPGAALTCFGFDRETRLTYRGRGCPRRSSAVRRISIAPALTEVHGDWNWLGPWVQLNPLASVM